MGLPNVTPTPLTEEAKKEQERKLVDTSYVLPWMEGVVSSSLPYLADSAKIRQTLEECKGNIDEAVSRLLDAEEDLGEATEKKDVPRTPSPKIIGEATKAEVEDNGEIAKEEPKDEASEGKSTKKPTTRQTRVSARIKAKEDDKLKNTGLGGGPDNPGPTNEESRKQPAQRPKRETAREKKLKQKEAAKARKREKNMGKKDEEAEKGTATITSGIKELYV